MDPERWQLLWDAAVREYEEARYQYRCARDAFHAMGWSRRGAASPVGSAHARHNRAWLWLEELQATRPTEEAV